MEVLMLNVSGEIFDGFTFTYDPKSQWYGSVLVDSSYLKAREAFGVQSPLTTHAPNRKQCEADLHKLLAELGYPDAPIAFNIVGPTPIYDAEPAEPHAPVPEPVRAPLILRFKEAT